MSSFDIRQANEDSVSLLNNLLRCMVIEMIPYGGYFVNSAPEVWASMADQVRANLANPGHIFFLAECGSPPTTAGMIHAYLDPLEGIFAVKTRLHISAVYTLPALRGQGVARQLLDKVLEWGKQMNAVEADLNVLVNNPARRLYEQLGFRPQEVKMVLPF